MIRTLVALGSIGFALTVGACSNDTMTSPAASRPTARYNGAALAGSSTNGAGGESPAFYDGDLFTINLKELSEDASASVIAHNPGFNEIYATNDLDDDQDFVPVIDAIQGDGFNPMWRQVLIVFNPGFTPRQFFSDEEVDAAAEGANPEITLVDTDEIYRCSVVGRK